MMPVRLTLLALLVLAVAPDAQAADGAEAAYRAAQREFWVLKSSPERQKLRHHWRSAAERFEAVASRFPKSDRAPDALYTAGQLFADLSVISRLPEDLDAAVGAYQRLLDRHAKDPLADDAAYALARLLVDRRGEKARARDVIAQGLKAQSSGDMAGRLRALLDTLPAPKPVEPPALARVPKKEVKPESPATKRAPAPSAQDVAASREAKVASAAGVVRGAGDRPATASEDVAERDAVPPLVTAAEDVAEPSSAPRPGASAIVPRAKAPGSSGSIAENAPRRARRVVADAPVAAARVAEPESDEPERVPGEAQAPLQVELAQIPPALAQDKGFQGPGKSLVDAVARFAREDVPRAFEDASSTRAREDAARRRLKAAANANRRAELTLAEQLGLKVRRVVIDAGHGGHDTGAIGKKGTREKDVALGIARRLGELLEEQGLEVVLTRDDDRFLKLEDRSRIANAAHGDLFISIHCNSAVNRKARGVETYTLNIASDRYSIRLAARENAHSEKGMSDLQFILADLATKANTEESSRLARSVQANLVGELSRRHGDIRDLGNKEALFFVLLGAKMPAILVETAFLSNAEEEARLATREYQVEVARGIAAGVEEFLGRRARVAQVR